MTHFEECCACSEADSGISTDAGSEDSFVAKRVHFADESFDAPIADIVEVESYKAFTHVSADDLAKAEQEWCTELLEQLQDCDFEIQRAALDRLEGSVLQLALSPDGFLVVQRAFVVASHGLVGATLAGELCGHVLKLARSPYGSAVLQSCLELLTPSVVWFIVSEMIEIPGVVSGVARSRSGRQVLSHILKFLPSAYTEPLVTELLCDVTRLSDHPVGRHVVEKALECGNASQRYRIRAALSVDTTSELSASENIAVS
jgi:hypothetical protein